MKYRIYIEQVNQTYVEVEARDREEAKLKGYAKWRREDAHSSVTWIEEIPCMSPSRQSAMAANLTLNP